MHYVLIMSKMVWVTGRGQHVRLRPVSFGGCRPWNMRYQTLWALCGHTMPRMASHPVADVADCARLEALTGSNSTASLAVGVQAAGLQLSEMLLVR